MSYSLSEAARNDLFEIWEYIYQDSPSAAQSIMNKIESTFDLLAEYPKMGHKRSDLTDKPVRFWAIFNYLIIYQESKKSVEFVRILNGFRDIAEILDRAKEV